VLEAFACLTFKQEQFDRSVRLWAAAAKLGHKYRQSTPSTDHPGTRAHFLDALRAIGTEAFEAAWLEGSQLTLSEAVSICLQEE
jgi:hypothetical protein